MEFKSHTILRNREDFSDELSSPRDGSAPTQTSASPADDRSGQKERDINIRKRSKEIDHLYNLQNNAHIIYDIDTTNNMQPLVTFQAKYKCNISLDFLVSKLIFTPVTTKAGIYYKSFVTYILEKNKSDVELLTNTYDCDDPYAPALPCDKGLCAYLSIQLYKDIATRFCKGSQPLLFRILTEDDSYILSQIISELRPMIDIFQHDIFELCYVKYLEDNTKTYFSQDGIVNKSFSLISRSFRYIAKHLKCGLMILLMEAAWHSLHLVGNVLDINENLIDNIIGLFSKCLFSEIGRAHV